MSSHSRSAGQAGFQSRQQGLAHGQVGDTNMINAARSSVRTPPTVIERPSRSCTANCGAESPTLRPFASIRAPDRRNAFVQNAELTHDRQQCDRQRDDDEPEHGIGHGERGHEALLSFAALGATSPSSRSTAAYRMAQAIKPAMTVSRSVQAAGAGRPGQRGDSEHRGKQQVAPDHPCREGAAIAGRAAAAIKIEPAAKQIHAQARRIAEQDRDGANRPPIAGRVPSRRGQPRLRQARCRG